MKKTILRLAAALGVVALGASCTTTYDAYGRPVQTVDAGAALVGVAAAGLIGYALADDGGHRRHRGHGYSRGHDYGHRGHSYGHSYGHGSGYRGSHRGGCRY